MKTLLLMRHGKSSWSEEALADHDRPLKKRGQDAADRIGLLLSESKLVPDHIQTSSAVRALETTQRVIQAAKWIGDAEVVPALYHADPKSLVAIVSRVPNRVDRLLVVGHNPGLENWLTCLIGRIETFPTAALAQVELDIESWIDLAPETRGTLEQLWRPKELS